MSKQLNITDLYIYPIKSLGGIRVNSAKAQIEGFEHDRRMMLVDEQGKFLSQREYAQLSQFKTTIVDQQILLSYDNESLNIPMGQMDVQTRPVTVWGSKLKAYEISDAYNEWFSDLLNQKVSLVTMGKKSLRTKKFLKAPFSTYVSLADGYPYLLLGKESLRKLNEKCPENIPIDRFRANIIVESTVAHEEDELREIKIGQSEFKNIKPCARCVVITIDQQNATKSKEPLATLSQYRLKSNKIYFGTNLICLKPGMVRVGDVINA